MVVIDALHTTDIKNDVGNVRSVVVTGNPYYTSNLPQDRGTAKSGSGIGRLKLGARELPAEFLPVTRDYCNEGDPVCQGGIQVLGGKYDSHHYNGTDQEKEFIAYTIQQLLT